jgi:N-acetylglucosamine kinase-like BadF-type ATPase
MILVADSGATKTDWRLIDTSGKIHSFSTVGFSPMFWTSKEISDELNKKIPKKIKSQVTSNKSEIFYYGTGCSSKQRNKILEVALKKIFPKAKIVINHDILASARALCGTHKGIACILGTGSNSCFYDGKKITKNLGGLTFILGDEGSGAHIGKEFIKAFLNDELPSYLHKTFQKKFHLTKDKIFDSVYNKKYPNRFLASFAKFISEHIDEPFVHELVKNCLTEFFEKTICKYENHKYVPVGFVGSIAFYFRNILKEVAKEKGVTITKIIETPIDELVKFHINK